MQCALRSLQLLKPARSRYTAAISRTTPSIAGCSSWTYAKTVRYYASRAKLGSAAETFDDDLFGDDAPEKSIVAEEESLAEFELPSPTTRRSETIPNDPPDRPKLPGSIKKLNRLLSRQRAIEIPESELDERFVKGRGPGGQAINKTNSSVSLTHIPTGIRVQAQPTRSREENRKVARRILAERLDILRATGQLGALSAEDGVEIDLSGLVGRAKRNAEEKALSGVYTKAEIRAEKERRRKANRAKKAKKKYAKADVDPDADQASKAVESDVGTGV